MAKIELTGKQFYHLKRRKDWLTSLTLGTEIAVAYRNGWTFKYQVYKNSNTSSGKTLIERSRDRK